MTTQEYISALRQAVHALPSDEAEQAVAYYDEYLRDADDPDAAMAHLGTPKEVAAEILTGYVGKTSSRPGIGVLWAIVIGILAAPLAAPIAMALFGVALAVVVSVGAVIGALIITAIGLIIGGLSMVVTGCLVIGQSFTTFAWTVGGGLLCVAVGLIGGYGIVRVGRLAITGLTRLIARLINRLRNRRQS